MAKRSIPEINAGSMADIAFLLLIFFLVTTTMNKDSGISRKLPEIQPPNKEDPPKIKEKNIFIVTLDRVGNILVENEKFMKVGQIKDEAIAFLDNGGGVDKDENKCDYCKGKKDPKSSDHPKKAVITLESARGTAYGDYIEVQNELVAAYNFLRDRSSNELYGINFSDLKDRAKNADNSKSKNADLKVKIQRVKDMYPMILSEAEPAKN